MVDGKHLSDILASNVASATKLQTPRTIWGRSFDGTANISGNLENVGNIYSTNNTFGIYRNGIYLLTSLESGQLIINAYDANIIQFGYRGTSGYSFYAGTGAEDAVGSEIGYWNSSNFNIKTDISSNHIYPRANNTYYLGTSSARWKRLYLSGINGDLLMGKTDGSIMVDSANNSTSTYFPLYRWKSYTGRVFNLGALQGTDTGHKFGFFMFDKDRTANGTDAEFYMNSYGDMIGNKNLRMNGDVVAYAAGNYDIVRPIAGKDALGMIKVGSGLSIDENGVLSSTGGGDSIAGVTPGTAGDFVYELASNGSNIVYNRKTFASVLDGRYVKKAGDTMTGDLTVNGVLNIANNKAIKSISTTGNVTDILLYNYNNNLLLGTGVSKNNGSTYIYGSNIYLNTGTDNRDKLVITSEGNVGIGTTNPVDRLEVAGAITANDIYPRSNNSYSVGYSSRRFNHGYFTQTLYVGDANTNPNSNSSNACIGKGYLELNATTPYIDFHYNNSTSDYTHRIIAYSGSLKITPSVSIGGSCYPTNSTTCMLGTSSLRWVRLYLTGINGNWISGKTDGAIMIDSTITSTSTYFPLYRWKTYTGRVFNLGGLQGTDSSHQFGFYMFDKDQTENRTNASFYMYSNGNMNGTHSLIMQQDVVAYGSSSYNITSPTAGYDALGLARFDSTYFTVSSGYVTLKASATSPIRSVTATTLNPGSNANASWNSSTGALSLGIPRGNTGATGTQGASVTYQWSGTSLRMGVTPYGGSTAWGSYVNLKGATGSPGPSWNGGEISNSVMINAVWAFCGLNGGGGTKFYLSQRGDNKCYFCFGNTEKNKASLSAEGNLYIAGNYSNGSDIRLKYRLDDVSNILYKIKDISAFYYIRKDLNDGIIRIGVSAQDVIKQFPEVVSNNSIDGKEYYSVEYATLGVAIAVNGLKEVHQLVQDNKNEIDLLKIEIASLKERLSKLEAA